jgi:Leucine-rich repeat (LRR) protein
VLEGVATELGLECSKLEYLDMRGNLIEALPESLVSLASLHTLELSGNRCRWLPDSDQGTWLEIACLELNSNCLRSLPRSSPCWEQLVSIKARGNSLFKVDADCWRSVTAIDLGQNIIETVLPSIKHCSSLTSLCLDSNYLTALPEEMFLLSALRHLNLAQNNLLVVPPEVGMLTSLKYLCIARNHIEQLCQEVGLLQSLTTLDASSNAIANLPNELFGLTALESLNISWNKFQVVPRDILMLSSLRSLKIRSHRLSSIPPYLPELRLIERHDLRE